MKVAVIGRSQLLYNTALQLITKGHEISLIITAPSAPEYTRKENDFENLAANIGARFFLSHSLDVPDILSTMNGLDIGVGVNWLSVVKQKHIDFFKFGILNAHMGDLPRYRGNACPNWAILNGEKEVVLSIHCMEGNKLDCGRIIVQGRYPLTEETYIGHIYEWAERVTPELFDQALTLLAKDPLYSLKYADDKSSESLRCYPRLPADSHINWSNSARDIHRLIRASSAPFPGAYTYHVVDSKMRKLYILKSRVIEENPKSLAIPGQVIENNSESGESLVQCGQGIIAIGHCRYIDEPEGFSPGSRWRTIRQRLGVRIEDFLWELQKKSRALPP